ncbi:metallophosphoesterase [uncultured Enorma sp.]|uniref:metallophosphoesterase family protein n=1 Tax=uncultured Enorma sp. TaxID=1714346 RepID=UPI0025EC69B1|nr:metallophosphoesterase [uncultured Enorma sp.]
MAVSGIKAVLRRLRVVAGRGGARLAVVLALVVATLSAVYPASARAAGDVSLQPVDGFTFGVMSDPHYFPAEYQGTRAEAYQNQTSGDLRLMGENEALTTAAADQMIAEGNLPSVLLVTGDLSSEGEQASHEGFAEQMARLQDAGVAVLVIPGNHDLYNDSAMTFQDDTQVRDNGTGELYTTEAEFREIYATMGYDEEATKAASNGAIESIDYYKPVSNGEVADCQGGLSYVARTNAGVAFLMIDTEVYTSTARARLPVAVAV